MLLFQNWNARLLGEIETIDKTIKIILENVPYNI